MTDKQRLKRLKKILSGHPQGEAMLTFAGKSGVSIDFNNAMADDLHGRTRNHSGHAISLNPRQDNALLASILYHEIHHVRQHRDGVLLHAGEDNGRPAQWPVRDPFAYLILNRVAEADAFARQAELAFDMGGAVAGAMKKHCAPVFNAYANARRNAPEDKNHALSQAFAAFVREASAPYDAQCLADLDQRINSYADFGVKNPRLAKAFFSTAQKFDLSIGLIRHYASHGENDNYLAAVPDHMLAQLTQLPPELHTALDKLTLRYDRHFSAYKGPAAP